MQVIKAKKKMQVSRENANHQLNTIVSQTKNMQVIDQKRKSSMQVIDKEKKCKLVKKKKICKSSAENANHQSNTNVSHRPKQKSKSLMQVIGKEKNASYLRKKMQVINRKCKSSIKHKCKPSTKRASHRRKSSTKKKMQVIKEKNICKSSAENANHQLNTNVSNRPNQKSKLSTQVIDKEKNASYLRKKKNVFKKKHKRKASTKQKKIQVIDQKSKSSTKVMDKEKNAMREFFSLYIENFYLQI